MNDAKYIGLDVHQATISATVLDSSGKLVYPYGYGGLSLLRRRPQFHFHPSFLQKAHQFISISFDWCIVTGATHAVFLHRYD